MDRTVELADPGGGSLGGGSVGPRIATARAAHSERGGVTNVTRAVRTVRAKPDVYLVLVRFGTPSGPKEFGIVGNGLHSDSTFPDSRDPWAVENAGKLKLEEGKCEITIERGG